MDHLVKKSQKIVKNVSYKVQGDINTRISLQFQITTEKL